MNDRQPLTPIFYDQHDYDVRCEWSLEGVTALAPISDVVIIVDVLSFSTAVDIVTANGSFVYPFRSGALAAAAAYTVSLSAVLAHPAREPGQSYTLSPTSLLAIPPEVRLVLPSPNGSTLSLATGQTSTFAGCLRNAAAVADAAQKLGNRISVIPAGERWPEGTLRPAIEDLIGAGAIIHYLAGTKSPEAAAAEAVFLGITPTLFASLRHCSSGKELEERGFGHDVALASELNVSQCAPRLVDGAFVNSALLPDK